MNRAVAWGIDIALALAAAALSWWLSRSVTVAVIVLVEVGIAFALARAATGHTPGSLATRRRVEAPAPTSGVVPYGRPTLAPGASRPGTPPAAPPVIAAAPGAPDAGPPPATPAGPHAFTPGPAVGPAPQQPTAHHPTVQDPTTQHPTTQHPTAPDPLAQLPLARPAEFAPTAATPAVLGLDTGERIPHAGVLLVGRAPTASGLPGELAVPMPDATRSLSRTHLRVGTDPHGVWVEDTGSANGTSVRTPDGQTRPAPAGERVVVPTGTVVLMGQRFLTIAAG